MSPKTKTTHPIEIHPANLAELRHRIETGPGFGAVADAAGMRKTTLWRVLHGRSKHPTTTMAPDGTRGRPPGWGLATRPVRRARQRGPLMRVAIPGSDRTMTAGIIPPHW